MRSNGLESNSQNNRHRQLRHGALWLALGGLALATCLVCLVAVTATGTILINRLERSTGEPLASSSLNATLPTVPALPTQNNTQVVSSPTPPASPTPAVTPTTATATATFPAATPTTPVAIPPEIQQGIPSEDIYWHLGALMAADYPARDYFETAYRLGRTEIAERTVSAQSVQVGQRSNFITDDGVREAVLMAVSEHAYFWVESTLDYDRELIEGAAQQFETDYFPAVTKLYGTEWQYGIDDDPRFSVLHLDGYAEGFELGFFNSGDQYPRSVNTDSNEQEVIYLNMENLRPGEPLYFGTLVHELQHLIQWHSDPNEPVWLSEGLAQFTELYVGLDTVDTYHDYLNTPGTRLNTWLQNAGDKIFAHYGAAYLFVVYFWEQFGDQAIQDLMRHPADGLAGVSAILAERDPLITLDQFVLDWATANYVDNQSYGPEYDYEHLSLRRPEHLSEITQIPYETIQDVEQFSASYIELDLKGEHTLTFAGDSVVELLPAKPHGGQTMWYVPALNEIDAQLTANFDLTGLTQAELSFWAWYDLEEGYDFAYISVSADGGTTWDLLMPRHAEAGEYGPALTGESARFDHNAGGWVQEAVSLAAYAGKPIMVRFEVVSDSAIAKSGFAVDDIAINELNFLDDVETDNEKWQSRGFVRTGHQVPQIWRLNLVMRGRSPQVLALDLDERNYGSWTIDLGDQGAVLLITAQTPFVGSPTSYWLEVVP